MSILLMRLFPFSNGVKAPAKAGATALIQPGGSIRDEESLRMASHYAASMIFTDQRRFRHEPFSR